MTTGLDRFTHQEENARGVDWIREDTLMSSRSDWLETLRRIIIPDDSQDEDHRSMSREARGLRWVDRFRSRVHGFDDQPECRLLTVIKVIRETLVHRSGSWRHWYPWGWVLKRVVWENSNWLMTPVHRAAHRWLRRTRSRFIDRWWALRSIGRSDEIRVRSRVSGEKEDVSLGPILKITRWVSIQGRHEWWWHGR